MSKKRILIIAITRLGDMLQASPTIVGLKEQYPEASITVVIDKQFATICSGIPGIDEVYVLDLSFVCRCLHREQDGIVEAFKYVKDAVEDLRAKNFDYCLNMSNSSYTALLIRMLGIPDVRGWLSDDEGHRLMADPWAMLFAAFVYHSNRDYNSLNLVDIFRCAANVNKHPRKLCYTFNPEAGAFAQQFINQQELPGKGPLIFIQAGASQSKRQWPVSCFSRVADELVEQLDARIVFTGSGSEAEIINEIIAGCRHKCATSAGKTNFDQLAALLNLADLLITGDTGPMHLAVAVETPVVALFLASALSFETGPYSAGNFVIQPQIECSPCNPNYPCSRPDCHAQVTPELVVHLAKLRLSTPRGADETLRLSPDIADPRRVLVFRTLFDKDGFLDFASMNGVSTRFGEAAGFYETCRAAYRALWKEEFADCPWDGPSRTNGALPVIHDLFDGLNKICELTDEGTRCIGQLVAAINDLQTPPRRLGELNTRLQELDRTIETTSLSYPPLGALVRISIMEKENMRGDDPLMLARETQDIYSRLQRRSQRFAQLFTHFSQSIKE